MSERGNTWALVLAGGEGTRLRSLTTTSQGTSIPKQFCSLRGGPSLLQEALQRARAIAPTEFICAAVAAQHQQWWETSLAVLPPSNVFVQPDNRGTANGILLPLLHILQRDPEARIVLIPSDHHVREENVLAQSLRAAIDRIDAQRCEVLLLGLEPEDADTELGYIVPGMSAGRGAFQVAQFVEKPDDTLARHLVARGAFWNVFIAVAIARTLLRMYEQRHPDIVAEMRGVVQHDRFRPADATASASLYDRIPTLDFSRDIISGQENQLHVMAVPRCGWSDLGTPKRVAETLHRIPRDQLRQFDMAGTSAHLNLASQQALLRAG